MTWWTSLCKTLFKVTPRLIKRQRGMSPSYSHPSIKALIGTKISRNPQEFQPPAPGLDQTRRVS